MELTLFGRVATWPGLSGKTDGFFFYIKAVMRYEEIRRDTKRHEEIRRVEKRYEKMSQYKRRF